MVDSREISSTTVVQKPMVILWKIMTISKLSCLTIQLEPHLLNIPLLAIHLDFGDEVTTVSLIFPFLADCICSTLV